MMLKVFFSYCKSGSFDEVESHQREKRAGLSFELGVACDAQAFNLISWGVVLVKAIGHYFTT